jgi:ornithine cyclodeaminase/alanine dehydrogenase-like protein (mu-crystallin family)
MAAHQWLVTRRTDMTTTPPALLLDRRTIAELLSLDECIAAVEAAFAAYARGETLAPGLLHGDGVGGEYHIKAGGLRTPHPRYACKINSSFFQNRATNGLPNIQGLIALYDAADGRPLAVMESAEITIKRTGSATAVAAKYLAKADARVATIVGAGNQGAIQLEALTRVRAIEQAFVCDQNPAATAAFAARLSEQLKISVTARTDLAAAVRTSEIVVTCTPSKRWIIGRDMIAPGTFVAGVGADSPDKQELEPALLAQTSVVTDLTEQCRHVGDLHHAIAAGLMQAGDVRGELGEVVVGKAPGRRHAAEIIIYDATGTALQDVAAAVVVYEKARALGRGTEFPFWG